MRVRDTMSGLAYLASQVVIGNLCDRSAGGSLRRRLTKSRRCLAGSFEDAPTKSFSQRAMIRADRPLHLDL
jgi:hypothetical protein